jgi:hypothetical protein
MYSNVHSVSVPSVVYLQTENLLVVRTTLGLLFDCKLNMRSGAFNPWIDLAGPSINN